MAGRYDGTIRIDSRVETKGFNDGVKKLGTSMQRVLTGVLKTLAVSFALVTALAIALSAVFLALVVVVGQFAKKLVDTLSKSLSVTSSYREKVIQLKTAFETLQGNILAMGATLLNALAPIILKVIDWLVKAVNWVSMFIAALTKQKTVVQYVSGSLASSASSAGKLADNTKKAKKAAEGALAAFDEINVLQQEAAQLSEPSLGVGGAEGGNIMMKEIPVPDDFIKASWEDFKDWFYENITLPIKNKFIEVLEQIKIWFRENFIAEEGENQVTRWMGNTEPVRSAWANTILWLKESWANFDIWFKEKTAGWGEWFRTRVSEPFQMIWGNLWERFQTWHSNAAGNFQRTWGNIQGWFYNTVIMPIRNAFDTALGAIKSKFETVFAGVKTFVKNVINGIISMINGMLNGIGTGINGIISALNRIKIDIPKTAFSDAFSLGINLPLVQMPQIPRLASGAVIPPNAQFAAILGDQKSGRNIEAPEGLIRQIIQEEIGNVQADIKIEFGGTLGSLVRELKPYIDRENVRVGSSLVKGSTV